MLSLKLQAEAKGNFQVSHISVDMGECICKLSIDHSYQKG